MRHRLTISCNGWEGKPEVSRRAEKLRRFKSHRKSKSPAPGTESNDCGFVHPYDLTSLIGMTVIWDPIDAYRLKSFKNFIRASNSVSLILFFGNKYNQSDSPPTTNIPSYLSEFKVAEPSISLFRLFGLLDKKS